MNKRRKIVETRSAGIDPFSSVVFTEDLSEWSDHIFVMEDYMLEYIGEQSKTTVLDIPKMPKKQLRTILYNRFKKLINGQAATLD